LKRQAVVALITVVVVGGVISIAALIAAQNAVPREAAGVANDEPCDEQCDEQCEEAEEERLHPFSHKLFCKKKKKRILLFQSNH